MIYILRRLDQVGYDEYDQKVVRALTKKQAREVANVHTGDEGQLWDDEDRVSCEEVFSNGRTEEILGSFCAG